MYKQKFNENFTPKQWNEYVQQLLESWWSFCGLPKKIFFFRKRLLIES